MLQGLAGSGVSKLWPVGESGLQPVFFYGLQRMVFTFLKSCKNKTKNYETEIICGPQSLNYLSDPLDKKFADPYKIMKDL